jgi:hypothetical protein
MNWIKNTFLFLKLRISKIMATEVFKFVDSEDNVIEVPLDQVFHIIIEAYFIIVVYKNATHHIFPADSKNLTSAYDLESRKKTLAHN